MKPQIERLVQILENYGKTIKTVIPASQHRPISSLKVNSSVVNDAEIIANEFNDFFSQHR